MRPREIYDELRRSVLGQDEALRGVSVAVAKHIAGQRAGNVLLLGSSGSGKTTIMRAVESVLARRPEHSRFANLVRIHANVLTEQRERPGRAVLERLWRNAAQRLGPEASVEDILRHVEHGIVFVDEIDKIRAHVRGVANVPGIVAQEALLTLAEGENVEFEIEYPERRTLRVDSSRILFVAAGAFEEVWDVAFRRAALGTERAPLRPVTIVSVTGETRDEFPFRLSEWVRMEDLFDYGMSPQFLARFDAMSVLEDLGPEELVRIFLEPPDSIFRRSRDWLARHGTELQITKGAAQLIAWHAAQRKRLGARALRDVWRRVIGDLEYEPPSGGSVMIDEARVRKGVGS